MQRLTRTNANERRMAMNVFLKVMRNLALCYVVGVLPASAEIPNHHIFYRNDTRAPITKIEIVFLGAGRNQERPSQIGLAETASWLIREYAKKHGYMDRLSALGARLNGITSTQHHRIAISTLSENCGKAVEIVCDLMHSLEFSESDLQHVKKLKIADYQNDMRRNTYSLMRNFAVSKTKGIEKLNSLKSLKALSLQDIRRYHDRLLKTEVVFFKVISDRDSAEVAKLLRPFIDGRQTGGFGHSLARVADSKVGPTAFVYTDYSTLKSVFGHWVIPCGSVGEGDYIPNLISATLRGDAQGLIYRYFREELGLVYGPSCRMLWSGGVRYLNIYADPRLDNSEELIAKMSDFIQGLSDDPRFWAALKERREILKVSDVHNQTPQRSLNREVTRAIYDRPIRGYDSVTDEEVRSFLEKYFVSQNLIMIFIGPKDHIIDILNTQWPEAEVHVQSVRSLIE